uniref:Uncharacterized protein n=2 Tax=Aromatoleum anaerobium TaxID=182180 RepID=A0ABX1PLQ6_9RHOO
MKHVTEHAGFAAAQDLLERLTAERDRLTAEQATIHGRMRWDNPERMPLPDTIDRAKAILEGPPVPSNRAGELDELRTRDLAIRERLEVLNAALRSQPSEMEHQRIRARAEALADREKAVAAIRMRWSEAIRKLQAAIAAEDALLDELVMGGFGRQEPSITAPHWLNRELFTATERDAKAA